MQAYSSARSLLLAAVLIAFLTGLIGGAVAGAIAGRVFSNESTSNTPLAPGYSNSTLLPSNVDRSLSPKEVSTVEAVQRIGPAIVTVLASAIPARQTRPGGMDVPTASGSGVLVSENGYVVTNYHVVADATQITVVLADGKTLPADIVASDWPFTDIAVLKVKANGLPFATLGDSDALVVGQQVLAIGSALGDYRNTVTQGIISGLNREWQMNDFVMENVIQTDAAINHGNSGGGLVDLSGQLIGINTSVIRRSESGDVVEGIGFAIPSNTVRMVVDQIVRQGKVRRPFLGISHQTWTPSLAYTYGVPVTYGALVTSLSPGGPADKAGMRINDILFKIGEDVMDERHPFLNLLAKHSPNERVTMVVFRDGKEVPLEVVLVEK